MTTRISNRLAELGIQFNLNEMYLGTFHSICLRLLEDYREFTRLKRSFTLFDQFDQQYFLYQRIKDFRELPDAQLVMGDDQTGRWTQSENLLKWLNKVSEEALDPATLAAAREVEIRALATCFTKYQELLREHNSLDFSGIQYEALQLLEKHPEVLAQLRDKLTALLVAKATGVRERGLPATQEGGHSSPTSAHIPMMTAPIPMASIRWNGCKSRGVQSI